MPRTEQLAGELLEDRELDRIPVGRQTRKLPRFMRVLRLLSEVNFTRQKVPNDRTPEVRYRNLMNALPSLTSARAKQRYRAVGVRLYLLYVDCNEMLFRGSRIAQLLDICKSTDGILDDRQHITHQFIELTVLLDQQRPAIHKIVKSMGFLRTELQVLDGEAFNKLLPELFWKDRILTDFTFYSKEYGLRRIIYLGPGAEAIADLEVKPKDQVSLFPPGSSFVDPDVRDNLPDQCAKVAETIANYLASNDVAANLQEIGRNLALIRSALENNFSLDEILPNVGSDSRGWS